MKKNLKKSFTKRIVAITLTLCMVSSALIPMSTITSSAKFSFTTLDAWVTNQIYSKGLSVSGKILNSLGQATGDATVIQITSFINSNICNNSDTTSKIKETCNQILSTVSDMEDVVEDINSNLKTDTIKKSADAYKNAWNEQVLDVMKAGNTKESFYGVYDAYLKYLECANDPDKMKDGKPLEDYENSYVSELESYYSHINNDYYQNSCLLNKNEYSKYKMYTTGAVDEGISGIIATMLYNMNPEKNSIGNDRNLGNRFVDKAAQYAYYAYPYSDEQAEFIDKSVECQVNMITTLVMIYQDFLARKADYYLNINYVYNNFILNEDKIDRNALSDSDKAIYDRMIAIKQDANESSSKKAVYEDAIDDIKINYATIEKCNATLGEYYDASNIDNDYVGTLEKYQTNVEKFMEGDLYLSDVKAYTTLDKYVRDDAATESDDVKTSFNLKNEKFQDIYKYDGNHGSQANVSGTYNSFYKNASVKAENGKLVFRPFYVLNGDTQNLALSNFNITKKCGNGTIFGGVFNAHYLTMDYQNFKKCVYTDGINKYAPATDPNQLKNLVNETYYTANKCTPYSYFAPFMKYANGKTNYLLMNGSVKLHDPIEGVRYEEIPVFNMNSSVAYSNGWSGKYIDYEDFSGAVYSLILVPQSTETKSKVDVKIEGEGKVEVSNNTPLAGDKVKVTVNAPNCKIVDITVQYHNDFKDPTKVTDEKQISPELDVSEYTLDYRVPYTNTTIVVKTAPITQ